MCLFGEEGGGAGPRCTMAPASTKHTQNPNLYNNQYNEVLKELMFLNITSLKLDCIGYCTGWHFASICNIAALLEGQCPAGGGWLGRCPLGACVLKCLGGYWASLRKAYIGLSSAHSALGVVPTTMQRLVCARCCLFLSVWFFASGKRAESVRGFEFVLLKRQPPR